MLELEPFESLALTLHHSPGTTALLIGSGVSRSAGIPTGWDITLDLIRRVASLRGVTEEQDWAAWYKTEFGATPDYSDLLDALATTPSERRAIVHSYIDPDPEKGIRGPAKAHHAIAKLVAQGSVRVIITTNFDRLIENALREAGIEPTVITGEDSLRGATPLVHSPCTVIKLHGDYLDTRMLNIASELSSYPASIDTMLDEIFDRFGLLIVGWSGEWDTALRAAIMRTPNRRYPLYWAARGSVPSLANDVIGQRAGRVLSIADADNFFEHLSTTLEALRIANRRHPTSVAIALAQAKQYCRDDRYALEWSEFLAAEVKKLAAFIAGGDYLKSTPDKESINALIAQFVSRTEVIRRSFMICGRWGVPSAKQELIRTLRALTFYSESQPGFVIWNDLKAFGASLCFYWGLFGAMAAGDLHLAKSLMYGTLRRSNGESTSLEVLPIVTLTDGINDWKILNGYERKKFPTSEFLFDILKGEAVDISFSPNESEELFDQVELLVMLEYAHLRQRESSTYFWAPPGRFAWRNSQAIASQINELGQLPKDSPLLVAGLLGGTPENAGTVGKLALEFFQRVASSFF